MWKKRGTCGVPEETRENKTYSGFFGQIYHESYIGGSFDAAMVNNSQSGNATVVTGGGKQASMDGKRGGEYSPESKQDCHNVVKSSGVGTKRRFCCEHGHRAKSQKVTVACQTDDVQGSGSCGNTTVDSMKKSTTAALDSAGFSVPAESVASGASALRVSATQTSPKQDLDDGSKCEGTLRLMIHNFRNMNDTVRGPAKVISGIPWKIMVMPRQHVVAKKGTQKCLGFFLQCFPESYSDSWSCQAAAELRLISQKPGVPNFVRKTNHVYTAKENDWGYSCFMTWADILDENQGYMKDENVILEVYVKAEGPKGILTHDQFCKKIQDYIRLSDMQSSRNLIDKALEVNQTALKFCKDKDEKMKEELEKQRGRLIEQKLKQSIERIEKGFSDIKPTENGETTLRQAIAGNFPTGKNSGGGSSSGNVGTKGSSAVSTPKEKSTPGKQGKEIGKGDEAKNKVMSGAEDARVNVDSLSQSVNDMKLDEEKDKEKSQQEVVDIDNPEAGTSDDSDDESDYEDIDEVCDSCLVEKLENMSCGGGNGIGNDSVGSVETQENGCQTESPVAKPRLPPIGASVDEKKGNESNVNNTTFTESDCESMEQAISQRPSVPVSTATTTTTVSLSSESEQKLLQLITEESKASLNTIKDTLERLVLLAQGGDTLPNSVQFDLDGVKGGSTTPVMKTNAFNFTGADSVKTDVVDIPPPMSADSGGKQQRTMEDHAKLVALNNQVVAQKKRQQQEQLESMIAEELNESLLQDALQRQRQFMQTDLSFTPRAGSPSEERALLARAQAIVENKAEELVTKYSQLIEQSEANRLAETVKKVEKRMKDIERQTMNCRKELSDECERHCREEQKLIKANKHLKQQLDQTNEKVEKLNNQLKEKRLEVKKLEKRLKAESQSSAENAELTSRIEQLERDLATCRQKHSDEKQRWNEETQKFHETKRSLQQELAFTTAEVERLHSQLEEKSASIRKLENSLKLDRQQAQSSLKEATERAKKAEVSLLELRLEIGHKSLQRALDECQSHVAQLEDAAKRFTRMQMNEEARTSQTCLQEWRKTRDKIQEVIKKAKNDFGQQIDAVKAGKALASLPPLEVPRPPPPPATPKLLLSVQTPPEQRQQHIAPIGTSTAASKGTSAMAQAPTTPTSSGGPATPRAPSVPPSAACNGPVSHTTAYHSSAVQNATSPSPNASAGAAVEPTGTPYEQTVFGQGGGDNGGHVFSAATSTPSASVSAARQRMKHEPAGASDYTPWSHDPLNIMQTLIGTKGGFNISAFDGGFNTSLASASSSLSPAIGTQQAGHELMNGGFGGGGGTPSGRPGQDGQQFGNAHGYHHWTQQSPSMRSSTSTRSQGNTSPPQVYDGRSDSPSEKQLETLSEQLRNIFPNLSPDFLHECVREFRHYAKNCKGMTMDQLLNTAARFVLSRQQRGPKLGTWSSSGGDSSGGGNEEQCAICGYGLRLQPMCSLPSCSHIFHSACAAQWLLTQRACPTCGVFALPPEEYPDLS